MGMKYKVGEKVMLQAKLNGPVSVPAYVQCVIIGADCLEVIGSPVNLTDCGDGLLFIDKSFVMVNDDEVVASYKVYSDALYTIPHVDFIGKGQTEVFKQLKDEFSPHKEIITGTIEGDGDLYGTIDDNELLGTISEA